MVTAGGGKTPRLVASCRLASPEKLEGKSLMAIDLKVNGTVRSVPAEPDTPLLYVLRNDLQLNGAKFGCGLSPCGACTVLVDGAPVRSCITPIGSPGQHQTTPP